jgi:hypothetical protein
MRLILLMALCLPGCSTIHWTPYQWTTSEKSLAGTALALHVVDTAQTAYGLENGYDDYNPIIGSTTAAVAIGVLAVPVVYLMLNNGSHTFRKVFLWGANVLKIFCVVNNFAALH